MKRALILLILVFVAAPGCMGLNPFKTTPEVKETPKPSPPPPVLVDEITPENAHKKAEALDRELDAADTSPVPTTPTNPAKH